MGLFCGGKVWADIPTQIELENITTQKTEVYALQTPKKQGTVVFFLSASCPTCQHHEDELKRIVAKHQGSFAFLGLLSNLGEDLTEARTYYRALNLFPVLRDAGATYADLFGALKTPHVFVLSANGKRVYEGAIDDSRYGGKAKRAYLDNALTQVKNGQVPNPKRTRTQGCYIQRK